MRSGLVVATDERERSRRWMVLGTSAAIARATGFDLGFNELWRTLAPPGAERFLGKPFSTHQLLQAVDDLLGNAPTSEPAGN